MEEWESNLLKIYPYNLVFAIFKDKDVALKTFVPGVIESLSDLPDKQRKILIDKYCNMMLIDELVEKYGDNDKESYNYDVEFINDKIDKALKRLNHPKYAYKMIGCKMEELHDANMLFDKLEKHSPEDRYKLCMKISDLFDTRIAHILDRAGISTVADLTSKTIDEIKDIKGIGEKAIAKILDIIGQEGLKLNSKSDTVNGMASIPTEILLSDLIGDDISRRVVNILNRNGLYTLGDVADLMPMQLMKIRGIRSKYAQQLMELLNKYHVAQRRTLNHCDILYVIKCVNKPMMFRYISLFTSELREMRRGYKVVRSKGAEQIVKTQNIMFVFTDNNYLRSDYSGIKIRKLYSVDNYDTIADILLETLNEEVL